MKELFKCKNCGLETTEPIVENEYTDVGCQSLCYATYYYCPSCDGDLEYIKDVEVYNPYEDCDYIREMREGYEDYEHNE